MEKIRLNDGTLLDIQSGATEYNIKIQTESVDAVASKLTDANLERYEVRTEDDAVCAIYTKKHLKKLSAEVTENGFFVTIVLEDINELYERVKTLEATVETLQAEVEATKVVVEDTATEETETEITENETVLEETETEIDESTEMEIESTE